MLILFVAYLSFRLKIFIIICFSFKHLYLSACYTGQSFVLVCSNTGKA